MATGRIGVTPTLGTRWSKTFSGVSTSVSGLDDNSVSLVYSVGYEQVYRNGVLLSRGNDYTATTGNSITLIDATIAGDIIEVFANQLVPLTDAISKGQFTAKGALLSATAASTPAVLTVGSNDQVLTADSTTSTGLKWATPASGAGNAVLIANGTLSGASVTVSGLSSYTNLYIGLYQARSSSSGRMFTRINNNSTSANYPGWWWYWYSSGGTGNSGAIQDSQPGIPFDYADSHQGGNTNQIQWLELTNCKNPGFTTWSSTQYYHGPNYLTRVIENGGGSYVVSEAVSSLVFINDGGSWQGGSYRIYGS